MPRKKKIDQLERARRLCLELPEATEKTAWGAPTFRVRDKMFAMFADDHHGDGRVALWCKGPDGVQESVVESEPERFFVPPYVGPSGWIGVHLDRNDDDTVRFFVRQAYCEAAPSKLRERLEAVDEDEG